MLPLAREATRQWLAGDIPLWNPYQTGGRPLLAMPVAGALYPLNFPHLFLSEAVAIEWIIGIHLVAASAFTYAFARSLHLSRIAACGAGLCFMLSGFVFMVATWCTAAVATIVWLPLGLLAIERISAAPRAPAIALLALSVSMSLLGGWVQAWTYAMLALGCYALVRVALRDWSGDLAGRRFATLAALAGGVLLGLGLAAAQLLPTAELRDLSPRAAALSEDRVNVFGGWTAAQVFAGMTAPSNASDTAYVAPWLGRAALLLLPLSVFARGRAPQVLAFGALAVLAWGVAAGGTFYELFRMLPTATWFRLPSRVIYLYAFGGAMLVGIAIDALQREIPATRARAMTLVVVLIAAAVQQFSPITGIASAALWCSAALIVGALFAPSPTLRSGLMLATVTLLAADLFFALQARSHRPVHAPEVVAGASDVYTYLRGQQGHARTLMLSPHHDLSVVDLRATMERIYSATDYSSLSLARFADFFTSMDPPGVDRSLYPFMGELHAQTSLSLEGRPANSRLRLLQLASIRFAVAMPYVKRQTMSAVEARTGRWRAVYRAQDSPLTVYENPSPLPRAYVAYSALAVEDGDTALTAISDSGFRPRHAVVIEDEDSRAGVQRSAERAIEPAVITRYEPTEVVIEVESDQAGHLVLTDSWYPGWNAEVDGAPATILRANHVFRAVALPEGAHRVTFRYEPLSATLGLAVSLFTFVSLLLAVLHSLCRKRRATVPDRA